MEIELMFTLIPKKERKTYVHQNT